MQNRPNPHGEIARELRDILNQARHELAELQEAREELHREHEEREHHRNERAERENAERDKREARQRAEILDEKRRQLERAKRENGR